LNILAPHIELHSPQDGSKNFPWTSAPDFIKMSTTDIGTKWSKVVALRPQYMHAFCFILL
jgi:hypothetical protein